MYKIQLFQDGKIETAAKHELVKGMPDEEFGFLFDEPMHMDATESEFSTNENVCVPQPPLIPQPPIIPQTPTAVRAPPKTASCTMTRFVSVDDDEVDKFVHNNENNNTRKKTLCHMKLSKTFLSENGEMRETHNIPPMELDTHLSKFMIGVRQKNGNNYQPSVLRGMLGSFERYLKRHRYGTSLVSGYEFSKTREVMRAKQKELKRQGMGNKPFAADAITNSDIDLLYKTKQLGCSTPASLINTLWMNNTTHFGMRGGGEEHRALCWGDIQLHYDNDLCLEYIVHNERQTKTRTGEDTNNTRNGQPRMYETPNNKERCPVTAYKQYSDKRPSNFSAPQHPFYLATITHVNNPTLDDRWFIRGPIGRNKIGQL
ncbi:zinc finger MYM-type protein 2-like [Mizuhopecten yessoensis]|uniref:zinc finger MYM-type protein 2-like n=1 Tax=Mizuhopecten yessoensis TaxID=6573 RepID=UPI000B45998E|nr:zinc finger MYM-type protein 2-like [Mizuhopecten yessoensis]